MRSIQTSAVALGAALLLGLAGASPSFAKAHDQGVNGTGGNPDRAGGNPNVSNTVDAAQGLGEKRGNSTNAPGQDKSDSKSDSSSSK